MKAPPIRDIALIGICAALLAGVQLAMAALPNIEMVSLLVILFAQYLGPRTLFVIYIFTLIEGLIFGFNIWWIPYLYVWTLLYFAARALRDVRTPVVWAAVSGLFGLLFGTLCSLPSFLTLGWGGGVAWIASGLYFDLLHAAGNLLIALLLYRPLSRGFEKALGLWGSIPSGTGPEESGTRNMR